MAGSMQAFAQDSLLTREFLTVKYSDPWLVGNNASALTRFGNQHISEADLYLSYGKGGWVDYYQSPEVVKAGAQVESFYRLGKRTVVYGSMGYEHETGQQMTGSAFINPTRMPFDIVEDSLTNEGEKQKDTYHLTGAIGVDLWRGWSIGARVDYTAANYAKFKDLRHKNKLLDLTTSIGIYMPITSWLELGANYLYRRNTESLTFSMYGKSEKVYKSFINYGPFIGRVEQFGNDGFTDKAREIPFANNYHGVEGQFDIQLIPNLSFYNRLSYRHRTGYYGRKSPYTITYTHHESDGYAYKGQLTYNGLHHRHALSVNVETENMENDFETYRERQNDNGAFYYEYYDPVKTGNRLWVNTHIMYVGWWNLHGDLPTWNTEMGLLQNKRKQTGYQYPYLRRQDIHRTEITAQVKRNILLRKGVFSLSIGGAYALGGGSPYEDDTIITPSDKQVPPPTMDAFMYREYQYFTSAQYAVNASAQYAFLIPKTSMKAHVQLGINHHKANGTLSYEQGKRHTQLQLSIGAIF